MLNERPQVRQMKAASESLNEGRAKIPAPAPVPKRANRTGLPDRLKAGVESLSGLAMDDVRVHYDSAKPAQLQALAYTQGTEIHVGPGQERHLPHEAWHVVQQKQGRVRATHQLKGRGINEDAGLEREADLMGSRAQATATQGEDGPPAATAPLSPAVVQLARIPIPRLADGDVTTNKLRAQLALIDQEIASIEQDELDAATVDAGQLANWRAQYSQNLDTLGDLVVDQDTGMSAPRIIELGGRPLPNNIGPHDERRLARLFYEISISHNLLKNMLNNSLIARERREAEAFVRSQKGASADKEKKKKVAAKIEREEHEKETTASEDDEAGAEASSAPAEAGEAKPGKAKHDQGMKDASGVSETDEEEGVEAYLDVDQLKHQPPAPQQPPAKKPKAGAKPPSAEEVEAARQATTFNIGTRIKGEGNRFNPNKAGSEAWHRKNTLPFMIAWAKGLKMKEGDVVPHPQADAHDGIHYEGFCVMYGGIKYVFFHCYPDDASPLLWKRK